MNCMPAYFTPRNRQIMARKAMHASIKVREKTCSDLEKPICVYKICEDFGVTVRFTAINMEGMYDRLPKPRIHLSALRPMVRRTFNCAHELGHHVFGHGSTIDELRNETAGQDDLPANEFLVNVFASFLLMPPIGIRQAFAARGCTPHTATPMDMFSIACAYGVGYETLITHLAFGLKLISQARHKELLNTTPQRIRNDILGQYETKPLMIADTHHKSSTLDTEVGCWLLLPSGAVPENNKVKPERDLLEGSLFQAVETGACRFSIPDTGWNANIRVSPENFVGLARYRHLEDDFYDQ